MFYIQFSLQIHEYKMTHKRDNYGNILVNILIFISFYTVIKINYRERTKNNDKLHCFRRKKVRNRRY